MTIPKVNLFNEGQRFCTKSQDPLRFGLGSENKTSLLTTSWHVSDFTNVHNLEWISSPPD